MAGEATTTATGTGATGSTEYLYPEAINTAVDTAANYTANIPGFAEDVYNNWYSAPLSTGQTPWQTQAWETMMSNPTEQWTAPLQQAATMYQQGANYDPSKLNQYLNPYTQGANEATAAQVNRNLMENILPNLNSTFAGAGQFGSSRNADFTNRAIRDTQTGLAEALAKQNVANYQNAQNDYQNWAKMGQNAAAGLTNVGGAGSAITQTGLTNLLTAATGQQQQLQGDLGRTYQDWLARQQFPIGALSTISGAASNLSGAQKPNVNVLGAQPDVINKVLTALGAINQYGADPKIQALIDDLVASISG